MMTGSLLLLVLPLLTSMKNLEEHIRGKMCRKSFEDTSIVLQIGIKYRIIIQMYEVSGVVYEGVEDCVIKEITDTVKVSIKKKHAPVSVTLEIDSSDKLSEGDTIYCNTFEQNLDAIQLTRTRSVPSLGVIIKSAFSFLAT